ncbi:hypothetical protein [Hydrogenophaga sp.]|uniref:hypothetical protein n=1 Tax=Hydrogenophaga sp. TaxID=1904254 RepID=UPI003D1065E9
MRQTWTGCILLSTALSSSAATLGRHSGAAIIGQPLDVRVQVLLAPGEDLANQCLNADVYYGDAQVSRAVVRSTPQKTAPDAEASVRIQAALPVNEPIVTLYVRAGCDTAFTRRFVLLADPLNEPLASPADRSPAASRAAAAPPPAVQAPTAPAGGDGSPGRAGAGAASAAGAAGGSAGTSAMAPARPSARAERPARDREATSAQASGPRPPSVVRRAPAPKPAPVATPRLQLDPVDLSPGIERDPVLRLSPSLLSEPGTSEEARAAAGRLWKAINASPEDILRDAGKLAELEAEATRLREAQAQAQARINELDAQVSQARDQRYRNWLVYLLGGLFLLALLALLLLWRRRPLAQGSQAWWSSEPGDRSSLDAPAVADTRKGPRSGVAPLDNNARSMDVDLSLDLDQDSSLESMPVPLDRDVRSKRQPEQPAAPLQAGDRRDFSPSALGVSRSVAAEELFDVQQQADFFVSLGEEEQAIQVLRGHLAESHEPSPLAYLDLFKLYHRLGRREDYDALRDEFNHVFNAGAPPFSQYADAGRGLDAYETAFSRIQSLWPQPKVLDLIEESIFRDANDDQVEVFDLEAYRELLLLHAIAKELIQRDDSPGASHSEFRQTSMQPLKADGRVSVRSTAAATGADLAGRNTEPMAFDVLTPASANLGLDINLNDLSEFSAFEATLPETTPPVEPAVRPQTQTGETSSNLIDFEVLDFMPPDEDPSSKPDDRR